MEGPSIVIATQELDEFVGLRIIKAQGTAKLNFDSFKNKKLISTYSWGKHLILTFEHVCLRIHFLMFGSYRIDNPRDNRIPKLQLSYAGHEIYFYSCAIKIIDKNFQLSYDFEADVMSPVWDEDSALEKISLNQDKYVCDVLMDQEIFAGVGNIIKNEVLYKLKMHPELKISDLNKSFKKKLVHEASAYSHKFFEWKLANELKRNWKIFRKKTCPVCQNKVTKRLTGKLERVSHYCETCQPLKKEK